MEKKGIFPLKYPRFILLTNGPPNQTPVMDIPDEFLTAVGEKIPNNVKIQFPNGRVVHVHYRRDSKRLTHLDPLYLELGRESGFFLVMAYKGNGIFSVVVIGHGSTEIEYGKNRCVARSPVMWQGWRDQVEIPCICSRPPIPGPFALCLANGVEYQGRFSSEDNCIHGLVSITEDFIVEAFDILFFTYRGNGRFDLAIFNTSKVENLLEREIIETDSSLSADSGIEEEPDIDALVAKQGVQPNQGDNGPEDVPVSFERVLSWSNVHGSCHGVHIPRTVKPGLREWQSGEDITLQTVRGSWNVGIVMNNRVLERMESIP
uniref:Uncharacterized protein n=1 Tax=Daucus carota subsp. sativus TaxID=79200 RepID=A0A175YKZ2_DAUCS